MALPVAGQILPETPQPNPQELDMRDRNACALLLQQSENAIHQQDFPAAIRGSQQAAHHCQDRTNALLLLARAQMLSKQFDSAIESLHTSLASDPQNVAALILMGQVQYLSNRDNEAEAAFQKAIAAAPEKPDPHYFLGRLEYEDGRIPQAVEQFQAAISLDSKYYKGNYILDSLTCFSFSPNNEAPHGLFTMSGLSSSKPSIQGQPRPKGVT